MNLCLLWRQCLIMENRVIHFHVVKLKINVFVFYNRFYFIGSVTKPITNDDMEHILLCLRVLSERPPSLIKVYTTECRQALCNMLQSNQNARELAKMVIHLINLINYVFSIFS